MTGVDIPIPEIQTVVHQPTIKEISYMGELEFFSAAQTFCFNKDLLIAGNPEGKTGLEAMNNFQIFMTLITDEKVKDVQKRKNDIISFFALIFPNYILNFLPRGLWLNNTILNHNFSIDENNFDIIQDAVKQICCISGSGGKDGFNPIGPKAAAIAQKLMQGRAKAAKSKGEKVDDGILSRYVSILTVGLESMSLSECLNLTIYQLYDLIERYGLYTSWDLDIKSRLAGGKPDSKPDDWMKNIH